jgi:hypothetical protein
VYLVAGLVEFHATDVSVHARRMSKSRTIRLLHGKPEALDRFGMKLPWLYKLDEAVRLLGDAAPSLPNGHSIWEVSGQDGQPQPLALKICAAATEYLGVSEILNSLDPDRQDLCCQQTSLQLRGTAVWQVWITNTVLETPQTNRISRVLGDTNCRPHGRLNHYPACS